MSEIITNDMLGENINNALVQLNNFDTEQSALFDNIKSNVDYVYNFSNYINNLSIMNSYQIKIQDNNIQIDESVLLESNEYKVTTESNYYVIENTSSNYLLLLINTLQSNITFKYDNGTTISDLNIEPSESKIYFILPSTHKFYIPLSVGENSYNVYELSFLPSLTLRLFPSNIKDVLLPTDFDTKIFKRFNGSIEELADLDQEQYSITRDLTSFSVKPVSGDTSYDLDYQNTYVYTGSTNAVQNKIAFGKYFYKYIDGVYNRKTYAYLSQSNEIVELDDQQSDTYNVRRHYTLINSLTNGTVNKMDLSYVQFEEPSLTFLNGSNATINELQPTNVITQGDITGLGISQDFVVVYIQGDTVVQKYYQSVSEINGKINLEKTPSKIWILHNFANSNITSKKSQNVYINYPSQSIFFLNTQQDALTLTGDTIEEPTVLGGAEEDILKSYVLIPHKNYKFTVQNHNIIDVGFVQFIIEYKNIKVPILYGRSGYEYEIYLEQGGAKRTDVILELLNENSSINKIFNYIDVRFKAPSNVHINISDLIVIDEKPIDRDINGDLKFDVCQRYNYLYDIRFIQKEQTLYNGKYYIGNVL